MNSLVPLGRKKVTMETHEELINYYENKLKKHKDGGLAVDWNCEEAQELLFLTLLDGLNEQQLKTGTAKILDVGCGLAALYDFLNREGYKVQYTGIDLAPEMIKECQRRFPAATFEVRDILQNPYSENSFDYVFLSGSVSLRLHNHERYVRRMIWRMFSFAKVALSFNLLSARALSESRIFQLDDLRYYPNPTAILAFCHTLTPLLNMRHDVAGWTFTMQLFKKQDICPRVVESYVSYLKRQTNDQAKDNKIANILLEVGAIRRTMERAPERPESADYWNFKGVCAARLGEQREQEEALKMALKINPQHEWANLNLGTIAHSQGDYKQARAAYEYVLSLDKANTVARTQLFYIALHEGRLEEAKKLISAFENPAEMHYFLGEWHFKRGAYKAAIRAYYKAYSAAPYLLEALKKVALAAQKAGFKGAELKALLALYHQQPYDHEVVQKLANYYFEKGAYKKVIELLSLVVFDTILGTLRGRAYYLSGESNLAREAWEENVADTGSLASLLDLAELEMGEGNREKAASYIKRASYHPEAGDSGWAERILNLTEQLMSSAAKP